MYKTLFRTIDINVSTLSITDDEIDSNSIIDVYTDNNAIYASGISVVSHTLTITFDGTLSGANVAVVVNNIEGSLIIPTKTSDLDNDSGFITEADIPTKTSDLENDSGFITEADVPTKTSDLVNDSGFITIEDVPTTSLDFSLTEKKVGSWLGEDLYMISYTRTGALASGFNSLFTATNIDKMIGWYLTVKDSSNAYYYGGASSSSSYSVSAELHVDNSNVGSFGVRTTTSWSNPTVYVTYLYTKVGG